MATLNNKKNNLLLKLNYDTLILNDMLKNYKFIVLFNTKQLDFNFSYIKNVLIKEQCPSGIWQQNLVDKLFSADLKFLSASIFAINIADANKLLTIINLLDNIQFFFLYKNRLSNLMNKTNFITLYNQNNKLWFLHFSIFKLLFNIVILLMYFITTFLKYIKIK